MPQPSPRSPAFEALMVTIEWVSMVAFVAITPYLLSEIWIGATDAGWLGLLVLLGLPAGFVAGNLFTGFWHFFADNFGSVDTPILGHALIFRFRQHHEHQTIICQLTFRELNGGLAVAMLPLLLVAAFVMPVSTSLWGALFATFALAMSYTGAGTNQVHRWAHDVRCPEWVKPFQKTGFFLSPRLHAQHHRAPHHVCFCITNDWLNPVLDRYRIWHLLADFFAALGVPQAEDSVMGSHRKEALAAFLASRG